MTSFLIGDLFSIPMVFNTIDEVRYVRSQMDNIIRQRLEDAGFVNFGFAGAGFAYMMSNQPLPVFWCSIRRLALWRCLVS